MTAKFKKIVFVMVLTAVVIGTLFVADQPAVVVSGSIIATAEARIGRPLTPMSYAGVARRTTRRAVAAGAAGAAAYGYCRQVVDAYGRVYTRC